MKKLWRVYYEETISYEDYVDADSEREAKRCFMNDLKAGKLTPVEGEVLEFEAEDCSDNVKGGEDVSSKSIRDGFC